MIMLRLWTRACKRTVGTQKRQYAQLSRTPTPAPPELAKLMAEYRNLQPRPVRLASLLAFGSPLTLQSVLASAEYTLSELPRRLVKRVQSFESLPYIVGTNPFISKILHGYRQSFQLLASHPAVRNLDDNNAFIEELNNVVKSHSNDIATMSKGFQECIRYMLPTEISSFLDLTISARIALRLIGEQHIAISRAFLDPTSHHHQVGVVDMKCSPSEMIKMCASFVTELCDGTLGSSPQIVLEGEVDATFAYVSVHLEYILTEILKNSFRASVEHHHKMHGSSSKLPLPNIIVTIAPPTPLAGESRGSYLSLRVRDEGGGINPANLDKAFSYAFTTAGRSGISDDSDDANPGGPYAAQHVGGSAIMDGSAGGEANLFSEITGKGLQTGLGTIAGLGYGLPMARLYASYFAGSLQLVPLFGHGTDCFIKLRCLDEGGDVEI